MKKKAIKATICDSINPRKYCRVCFAYDENYYFYFPLLASDKLFLGLKEDEFMTDGYSVRRFKDVIWAEAKDDIYAKILEAEGIIDRIVTPEIDIENWQTLFESLLNMQINVIVEKELRSDDAHAYTIGRIEKVNKNSVCVRHFDANGIWQDKPYKIPYRDITSVTFHSRYIDVFSKYVSVKPYL